MLGTQPLPRPASNACFHTSVQEGRQVKVEHVRHEENVVSHYLAIFLGVSTA